MKQTIEINTISQLHQIGGLKNPQHQLVSVIHNREIKTVAPLHGVKVVSNLYVVIYKSTQNCSTFSYGRNLYDYEEGTLVFTAPGQVMEFENENIELEEVDPEGWTLVFHPNIFRKSELTDKINKYSFFHNKLSVLGPFFGHLKPPNAKGI